MSAILVTFVLGVAGGIVVLFVEYGVLRRDKRSSAESILLPAGGDKKSLLPPERDEDVLSWPAAIDKAVNEFSKLHPSKRVSIQETRVIDGVATLILSVTIPRAGSHLDIFVINVRQDGEIIRIIQNPEYLRHRKFQTD